MGRGLNRARLAPRRSATRIGLLAIAIKIVVLIARERSHANDVVMEKRSHRMMFALGSSPGRYEIASPNPGVHRHCHKFMSNPKNKADAKV